MMKKLLTLILLNTFLFSCTSDEENVLPQYTVTEVKIDRINSNIYIGDTYQMNATHSHYLAKTPEYVWESSDFNKAIVDDKGILLAKDSGQVTITVIDPKTTISDAIIINILKKSNSTGNGGTGTSNGNSGSNSNGSNVTSGRCIAKTKNGARCKRTASKGSSYCWQHK